MSLRCQEMVSKEAFIKGGRMGASDRGNGFSPRQCGTKHSSEVVAEMKNFMQPHPEPEIITDKKA
jgi:hypothetical protein